MKRRRPRRRSDAFSTDGTAYNCEVILGLLIYVLFDLAPLRMDVGGHPILLHLASFAFKPTAVRGVRNCNR